MANKAMKELKNLSIDELKNRVRTLEKDLFQNKLKGTTGQLADPSSIWKMRKTLARVKTLLGAR